MKHTSKVKAPFYRLQTNQESLFSSMEASMSVISEHGQPACCYSAESAHTSTSLGSFSDHMTENISGVCEHTDVGGLGYTPTACKQKQNLL